MQFCEGFRAKNRPGSIEDARWHSYGANKAHGLRRTNDDKAQAVKAALGHPNAARLSNYQIAAHCGVAESTVRNYRAELDASSQFAKMRREREVTRGGQTYIQDTTNIGRRPAVPTFTPEPDSEPLPFTDPPDGEWALCRKFPTLPGRSHFGEFLAGQGELLWATLGYLG